MTLTARQIVEARAPQLAGSDRLQDYLSIATSQTSEAYGANYQLAIALLCLHMMETDRRNSPGPIISRSEGQLSIGYGWSGVYGELASTHWGNQLLDLKKRVSIGFRNRMVCR